MKMQRSTSHRTNLFQDSVSIATEQLACPKNRFILIMSLRSGKSRMVSIGIRLLVEDEISDF
jgi:hypothetical protein